MPAYFVALAGEAVQFYLIDECPFLCYDNQWIIMNSRKGHFLWEKPQKISQ